MLLLHRFTMLYPSEKRKEIKVGYAASEADVVAYYNQRRLPIKKFGKTFARVGKYSLDSGVVYPSLVIQVTLSKNTGKIQSENKKARN